jgi:alkyl hydroperoxide reductase subunit AhpC
MTRTRTVAVAAMMLLTLSGLAQAARVGEPAPDFTGTDSHGKTVRLADLKGKFVVLEWHNDGCPYVGKHYGSGNMQRLQREWTGKGVVWLTVISSAEGQQGYVTADQADAYFKGKNGAQTAVLLDPTGTIGRIYDARTTPHMFVIDPKGTLIYNGAIDDKPTTDRADVAGATNYVSAALTEAMSGKPVTRSTSRPYGCSVKYGSTS